MLVCHCLRVFDGSIRECVRSGAARTVDEVSEACGAGTGCGGCRDSIAEIVDRETSCPRTSGFDVSLISIAARVAA
jgi:bacterioferritin-associated ferredoxin